MCYLPTKVGMVGETVTKTSHKKMYLGGSATKNLPAVQEMQEMQVLSLGRDDPLEEEMATHSGILAWRAPWTEWTGGLWFMGLQRVRLERSN